jgi:replicative DNA helicase
MGNSELRPSEGRVPPNDLDAEAAVLSAVLMRAAAFDVVQPMLAPEHFYSDANRQIFESFGELAASGRPVDILTVRSWLTDHDKLQRAGGSAYLAQILDSVPVAFNFEEYARIVREKWRVRQLIAECQRVAAEGYGAIDDPQAFIDAAEQAVYDIARSPESSSVHHVQDAVREVFDELNAAEQRGTTVTGTPSGITRLDRLTGGFNSGDLVIVAARPGMGKTALVLNMAVNVAAPRAQQPEPGLFDAPDPEPDQGPAGVAIFSLEMPRKQLATRLLCAEARVDVAKLRNGGMQREDWVRLTAAAGFIARAPIWIDDTSDQTVLGMRAKVRRIQAMYPGKLGLVAVDYLQLMSGNPKVNREQQIAEISRGLKKLAKDLEVPVVALSQLNRAVETRGRDKRPQLSDLRESGAIEQDADAVLFIYREEYYNKDDAAAEGLAELILAKQRNGPTGKVRVRFTKSCTRFDNLANEDYDAADDEREGDATW